jgi:hypothetical protein
MQHQRRSTGRRNRADVDRRGLSACLRVGHRLSSPLPNRTLFRSRGGLGIDEAGADEAAAGLRRPGAGLRAGGTDGATLADQHLIGTTDVHRRLGQADSTVQYLVQAGTATAPPVAVAPVSSRMIKSFRECSAASHRNGAVTAIGGFQKHECLGGPGRLPARGSRGSVRACTNAYGSSSHGLACLWAVN